MGAADYALKDAQLELTDEERNEAAAFIGVRHRRPHDARNTKQTLMETGPQKISPYAIPASSRTSRPARSRWRTGLKGPSYCTTSACSSGASHRRGLRVDPPRPARRS